VNAIEPLSAERIRAELRPVLGDSLAVARVPDGFVIGCSSVTDRSGDPIDFYLIVGVQGMRLEDDGGFLGEMAAAGVDLDAGPVADRVGEIVRAADLHVDHATGEIWTDPFPYGALPEKARVFADAQRRLQAVVA
jgi:hypothetical protein